MIDDTYHPILERPSSYDLINLAWSFGRDSEDNLDMTLRRGDEVRRLRFVSPQNVKIDRGFHGSLGGFVILDITKRQWDDLRVEVINVEQDPGITFVAAKVIDLDSPSVI